MKFIVWMLGKYPIRFVSASASTRIAEPVCEACATRFDTEQEAVERSALQGWKSAQFTVKPVKK